ncbi:hypothetical protein BC828DRAFT_86945 [Blastocladiella britannica]|nr:hypothetical protein BC828DRAFT_86945 [Blastocladiella britannica]
MSGHFTATPCLSKRQEPALRRDDTQRLQRRRDHDRGGGGTAMTSHGNFDVYPSDMINKYAHVPLGRTAIFLRSLPTNSPKSIAMKYLTGTSSSRREYKWSGTRRILAPRLLPLGSHRISGGQESRGGHHWRRIQDVLCLEGGSVLNNQSADSPACADVTLCAPRRPECGDRRHVWYELFPSFLILRSRCSQSPFF